MIADAMDWFRTLGKSEAKRLREKRAEAIENTPEEPCTTSSAMADIVNYGLREADERGYEYNLLLTTPAQYDRFVENFEKPLTGAIVATDDEHEVLIAPTESVDGMVLVNTKDLSVFKPNVQQ